MREPRDTVTDDFRLDVAPGYLLILLAPVAVYLLLDGLLQTFGDTTFQLPFDAFAEEARIVELIGRYKYMAALAFFGTVSISILLIFTLDLFANFTRRSRLYAFGGLAFGATVGVILSVLEPNNMGGLEAFQFLGGDFFNAALGQGVTGYCAECDPASDGCCDKSAMAMFRTLADPVNGLTSFAAAAAMTGLIMSLGRPRNADSCDLKIRVALLTAAQTVAQRYLYCAGLLLTAGITFLMAWMYWPAGMIVDETLQASYREMVSALSLYIGVGYSVMILSCYLPVMLIHVQRLDRLRAELAGVPKLPDLELPAISPVKSLNAIVAILSPILASTIGGFGQGILFQ